MLDKYDFIRWYDIVHTWGGGLCFWKYAIEMWYIIQNYHLLSRARELCKHGFVTTITRWCIIKSQGNQLGVRNESDLVWLTKMKKNIRQASRRTLMWLANYRRKQQYNLAACPEEGTPQDILADIVQVRRVTRDLTATGSIFNKTFSIETPKFGTCILC